MDVGEGHSTGTVSCLTKSRCLGTPEGSSVRFTNPNFYGSAHTESGNMSTLSHIIPSVCVFTYFLFLATLLYVIRSECGMMKRGGVRMVRPRVFDGRVRVVSMI